MAVSDTGAPVEGWELIKSTILDLSTTRVYLMAGAHSSSRRESARLGGYHLRDEKETANKKMLSTNNLRKWLLSKYFLLSIKSIACTVLQVKFDLLEG